MDSSGLLKKEKAIRILEELAPILETIGVDNNINIDLPDAKPTITPKVEPKQQVVPPRKTDPNKKANENNFTIDGTKINIGDLVGSLQRDTTYSSGGLKTVTNNLIVIQPVIQGVLNS